MDHCDAFRRLHAGPEVLVLANCWDAGTARLIASLGARAIATSSAGVAWSHGHRDGDALPLDALVATVRAIARVIDMPLSVDVEGGYVSAVDSIAAVVDAGAVGVNLEDGVGAPALLAEKIAAVRARGLDVFVNARTDVYLRGLAAPEARVAETIVRARRYRDAGADGLFVPGVIAADEIAAIAAEVALPLNVLARPGLPSAAELASLGVRRLSSGSALAQSQWTRTAALARGFLGDGASDPICRDTTTTAEINAMF
jgi:2-methylisocitrate lyase-like PEP mutase family enzyme